MKETKEQRKTRLRKFSYNYLQVNDVPISKIFQQHFIADLIELWLDKEEHEKSTDDTDSTAVLKRFLEGNLTEQEEKFIKSYVGTVPLLFGGAEPTDQPDGFGTDSD